MQRSSSGLLDRRALKQRRALVKRTQKKPPPRSSSRRSSTISGRRPGASSATARASGPKQDDLRRRFLQLTEDNILPGGPLGSESFDAFTDSITKAEDVAVSAFDRMNDALTQFATTGKLSFKGMADSIIADIARMSIEAATSQIFGLLFQSFFSPASAYATGTGSGFGIVNGQAVPATAGSGAAHTGIIFEQRIPAAPVPPPMPRAAQQAPVVHVTTPPGHEAEARGSGTQEDPLEIVITRVKGELARDVADGGDFGTMLDTRYGTDKRRF